MPEDFVGRLAPLLDDNLLRALDRNDGWLDFGGVLEGEEFRESAFLKSFEPGATAAPNGFGFSKCGLGTVIVVEVDAGDAEAEELFELENLELKLDIHEFRRTGGVEGAALRSFAPFGEACAGVDPSLSTLARVGR